VARRYLPLTPDLATLTFGERSPNSEFLARYDRELKTFALHCALSADLLGCARRRPSLREKEIGIGAAAVGKVLPRHVDTFSLQRLNEVYEHVVSYNSVITLL